MLQLDLREVYTMDKKSEQLMSISDDQNICRLCMQLVGRDFRYIHDEEVATIEKLVPEMNINIIKNPVVCKECFDSLSTHNLFIKKCFHVGEKISDSSAIQSQINDASSLDLFVKTESLDEEWEIKETEMSLKVEPIEIKSEENEEECGTPLPILNEETTENSNCKGAENGENMPVECGQSEFKSKLEGKSSQECDDCNNGTSKSHLTKHSLTHKDNSLYKHDVDDSKLKGQYFLRKRQLKHKKHLEIQMNTFNDCDFKSEHKGTLASHQLRHKKAAEDKSFSSNTYLHGGEPADCEVRDKSVKKANGRHQLNQKDFSEVQIYKCDACSFKTKYKSSLTDHQLVHKNVSDVTGYTCDLCDFRSIYKTSLKTHKLKHKDFSEVQMYKCDRCDYRTKRKDHLTKHQLKHKSNSEVQLYKCYECNFKTKYISSFKVHQSKHNNISETDIFGTNY